MLQTKLMSAFVPAGFFSRMVHASLQMVMVSS